MTTWVPDPQLDTLLSRIVARAKDEALAQEARDGGVADAQFAARGTYNSGGRIRAREQLAEEALRSAGRRMIGEALPTIVNSSPGFSPELTAWLRRRMYETFDGLAGGFSAGAMAERVRANLPISGVEESFRTIAMALRRDLEIELGPIEMRARLGAIAGGDVPSLAAGDRDINAFVCHAGEDKADIAKRIADALTSRGFKVWLDQYELKVGMSVYQAIDDGLRRCRFGLVILSSAFFLKNWPQRELHALAALGASEGRNRILPVWHMVGQEEVARFSPLLADVYAAKTDGGLDRVIEDVAQVLRP